MKAGEHNYTRRYWVEAMNGRPQGRKVIDRLEEKLMATKGARIAVLRDAGGIDGILVVLTHERARVKWADAKRDLLLRMQAAVDWAKDGHKIAVEQVSLP